MYCSNCGKEVKDTEKFCRACGTPTSLQASVQKDEGSEVVIEKESVQVTSKIEEKEIVVKEGVKKKGPIFKMKKGIHKSEAHFLTFLSWVLSCLSLLVCVAAIFSPTSIASYGAPLMFIGLQTLIPALAAGPVGYIVFAVILVIFWPVLIGLVLTFLFLLAPVLPGFILFAVALIKGIIETIANFCGLVGFNNVYKKQKEKAMSDGKYRNRGWVKMTGRIPLSQWILIGAAFTIGVVLCLIVVCVQQPSIDLTISSVKELLFLLAILWTIFMCVVLVVLAIVELIVYIRMRRLFSVKKVKEKEEK